MRVSRTFFRCILDVTVLLSLSLGSLLINIFGEPFKRGFFLNDDSIKYPYKKGTVDFNLLVVLGVLVPIIFVVLVECGIHAVGKDYHQAPPVRLTQNITIPGFVVSIYRSCGLLLVGHAATELATEIPKLLVGRLRPHFLAVCQPNMSLVNDTTSYITDDICTSSDKYNIDEARRSFPSGHSSTAMFATFYLIFYLLHRLRPFPFLRMGVYFISFTVFHCAVYVVLSRISDYKHHWSDVLAGSLLGITSAGIITFRFGGRMSPWMAKEGDAMATEEALEAAIIAAKRAHVYLDNPIFRSQELQVA